MLMIPNLAIRCCLHVFAASARLRPADTTGTTNRIASSKLHTKASNGSGKTDDQPLIVK